MLLALVGRVDYDGTLRTKPTDSTAPDGLPTEVIQDWESRIGIQRGLQAESAPPHQDGHNALPRYDRRVTVDVGDPDDFDSMMYIRQLSSIGTFCSLETPGRVERTDSLIREQRSDDLVVRVHTMPGLTTMRQGSREHAYGPGQLVMVSNAIPHALSSNAFTDPYGLLIPLALMGPERNVADRVTHPVAFDDLLSRATAGFIREFVSAAITGTEKPQPDTELAAVELVRAAVGQLDSGQQKLTENTLFLRQATIDLIERNHRDPAFNPDVIARILHLSRRQLYRQFQDTAESLATLIADRRLETAHEMVTGNITLSIAEISVAAGFPSVPTMRNRFLQRYGISPNALRHYSASDSVLVATGARATGNDRPA